VLYITLLDQFHPGIYSSQVIDVCDYLNQKHNARIRVVAFLSIKELRNTDAKKKLKELSPNAIVLPAFPKLKYFQWTAALLFLVCLVTGERVAICRNVFCTKMALKVRRFGLLKKIVFDGRSAMAAEIGEYDVFPVEYLRKNVKNFEKLAVNNSDFRMAVSQKLVDYWREHYGYEGKSHVIIPCTLDSKYFNKNTFEFAEEVPLCKKEMGIKDEDIVLVYAGSTAPWQSFELLEKALVPLMEKNENVKLLFLSKETPDNLRLQQKFGNRVIIKWLNHNQVPAYLMCCDYGILLREQSDTNKVASPTKFAEYLYAGLPVLISANLGDFSEFVQQHNCGVVWDESKPFCPELQKTDLKTRDYCNIVSLNYFTKNSKQNSDAYTSIVSSLQLVS